MGASWQIGVDIGGTFTDIVAFQPSAATLRSAKVASTPDDPLAGLHAALEAVGISWPDVAELMHGTTLVTNAIVENKLATVTLITTEGFADTLAIGRQNRRHLYRLDLAPKLAAPVPADRRLEVRERLAPDGSILLALDDGDVDRVIGAVTALGAEAVAVCLLHAYMNPAHEEELGRRLEEATPYVSLSHRVNPEAREYERSTATVLNAGTMPLAAGYLDRLEAATPAQTSVHLFHSAGGMVPPSALKERPLALALSGPAAGVSAAQRLARELAIERAISFDMGGTTTDVCLILDGQADIRAGHLLAERPLCQPMVAVESIGAGGGSLVRAGAGALDVGPESAGADPGPASYGRGGTQATVTDANLILGYLSDARRLGGRISLDRAAAKDALRSPAAALGVGVAELALGIHRVANANMMRALRRVTVERGIDGRGCSLIAFGGAGPIHAAGLAREFGISKIIVPKLSSQFSALGCVAADLSYSQQQTVRMASEAWDAERLEALREGLIEQLRAPFIAAGYSPSELREEDVALVRYVGQSYALDVPCQAPLSLEALGRDFYEIHHRLYGFATDEAWELQALRLRISGPSRFDGEARASLPAAGDVAPRTSTPCWFDSGEPLSTPRYERGQLPTGWCAEGPAIIEDDWSTVLVPPDAAARIGTAGHIHLSLEAAP